MKIKRLLCLALALCFLLSACASQPSAPELTPEPTPEPTSQPTPTPEPTPEPTPMPTPEPTPIPAPELKETPYIEIVNDPNQPIYSGPGYDYEKVSTVKVATGYTIMEEVIDYEGNLWGRLKSGAGWIDLSDARTYDGNIALVTVIQARGISSPSQADYAEPVPEYMEDLPYTFMCFKTSEDVTDVRFMLIDYFAEGYSVLDTIHTMPSLAAGKEYIVGVFFPGDFTTFGFQCTDSSGLVHQYFLMMSGRNGELVLMEYIDPENPSVPDIPLPVEPTPNLDIQTS